MGRTRGKWEVVELDETETEAASVGIIPVLTVKEEFSVEMKTTRNNGSDIAHCYGPDRLDNAAMIVASPLLLAALETILREGLNTKTRTKANAAIKLARIK